MQRGKIQATLLVCGLIFLAGCQKETRVGAPPPHQEIPAVPKASDEPKPKVSENPISAAPSAEPSVATPVAVAAPTPVAPEIKPPKIVAPPTQSPIAAATALAPVAPKSKLVLPLEWVKLGTLEVADHNDRTAQMEVGVEGKDYGKGIECEFVAHHRRIPTAAKWSPLPILVYSVSDKQQRINPVFNETLDFPVEHRLTAADQITFVVEFTRGKTFRGLWQAKTRLYKHQGKPYCSAQLNLCLSPEKRGEKFACTQDWRELKRLITHVNTTRYIRYLYYKEREKDDLDSIELQLRDLDDRGYPKGNVYSEDVSDFQ